MAVVYTRGVKSTLPIRPAEQDSLYRESIVIDAYAPLASEGYGDRYHAGGITMACAPVYPISAYASESIYNIAELYKMIEETPYLMQIQSVADIYKAKEEGKFGILLMFHDSTPLQGEIGMLDIYYRLGIRQMMLCYSGRNLVGDGCHEKGNAGLSAFGKEVIDRMNKLGILIDLSRAGYKTSMEAIEHSAKPCVFSHSNSDSVFKCSRNIRDVQAIAVAKKGGVIGINGFPNFISKKVDPNVDDFIKHIDYFVNLVGIEHVCLGIDYYRMQAGIMSELEARAFYKKRIQSGQWEEKTYKEPPFYYPEEIRLPERLPNIVSALRAHKYSDEDIRLILGENYLRVLKAVL